MDRLKEILNNKKIKVVLNQFPVHLNYNDSYMKLLSMRYIPVIDLHCDLLGCVEQDQKLNFISPKTNCSLPQLLSGGVILQILALFTMSLKGSSKIGRRQVELYHKLLKEESIESFDTFSLKAKKTHVLFAVENASTLLDEDESMDLLFKRFEEYQKIAKILYVSLTWNHENRFGGGNDTQVGLKSDGRRFLEYLSGKNIAIDLSHASDFLAFDILNHIDKRSLQIPVIASHSNYRKIKNVPRNLPDELAKEIIHRKGIIGLNFVKRFIGKTEKSFYGHIAHAFSLGGENYLCLGADFYGGLNFSENICTENDSVTFFEAFSNSSCYPRFLHFLKDYFSEEQIKKIAYENVFHYLQRNHILENSQSIKSIKILQEKTS